MNEERRRILDMLAEGKISVDEAEKLLSAISAGSEPEERQPDSSEVGKPKPKYLRIVVEPDPKDSDGERVNIRVPLNLVRAGLKWAPFVPKHARTHVHEALHKKGIEMDFTQMKPEDIEEFITNMNDLTVDVEGKEKVRIFCE